MNRRYPSYGFRDEQVAGGLLPQTRSRSCMMNEDERMNRMSAYGPTPYGGGFGGGGDDPGGGPAGVFHAAAGATSIDIHEADGGDGSRQRVVAQSYPGLAAGGGGGSGMLTSAAEGASRAGVRLRVAIDGALGLKKNKKNKDLSSKTQ